MKNEKLWKDEAGNIIPKDRITPLEKLREKHSGNILKAAVKANQLLVELKRLIEQASREVFAMFAEQQKLNLEKYKGNYTWYNFDRSVKIEIAINELTSFDELLIAGCKEKLMQFLDQNVTSSDEFIKNIILDAFNTSTGKLDTRKVTYLLKYQDKVKNPLYKEAMLLLRQSMTKPTSKQYSRVWLKDESGEYVNIDLNYSSIKVDG